MHAVMLRLAYGLISIHPVVVIMADIQGCYDEENEKCYILPLRSIKPLAPPCLK
jgi:hypothetical protein